GQDLLDDRPEVVRRPRLEPVGRDEDARLVGRPVTHEHGVLVVRGDGDGRRREAAVGADLLEVGVRAAGARGEDAAETVGGGADGPDVVVAQRRLRHRGDLTADDALVADRAPVLRALVEVRERPLVQPLVVDGAQHRLALGVDARVHTGDVRAGDPGLGPGLAVLRRVVPGALHRDDDVVGGRAGPVVDV